MSNRSNSMAEIFGGPINTYGRSEAIEDGVLVDVTETACEAGFAIPVALTIGVWEDCVGVRRTATGKPTRGSRGGFGTCSGWQRRRQERAEVNGWHSSFIACHAAAARSAHG